MPPSAFSHRGSGGGTRRPARTRGSAPPYLIRPVPFGGHARRDVVHEIRGAANHPLLVGNLVERAAQAHVLFGIVARAGGGAPLNSAVLVSPEGEPVSRYDKVNLVPFGEYVPWPFGFANKISTELGDFAAGNRVVVSPVVSPKIGTHKISTFICYESVFPGFVRKFAAGGAEVLFNISNDGWFGKSAAREQHLNMVRMRAAENRRWILRSTNDG